MAVFQTIKCRRFRQAIVHLRMPRQYENYFGHENFYKYYLFTIGVLVTRARHAAFHRSRPGYVSQGLLPTVWCQLPGQRSQAECRRFTAAHGCKYGWKRSGFRDAQSTCLYICCSRDSVIFGTVLNSWQIF